MQGEDDFAVNQGRTGQPSGGAIDAFSPCSRPGGKADLRRALLAQPGNSTIEELTPYTATFVLGIVSNHKCSAASTTCQGWAAYAYVRLANSKVKPSSPHFSPNRVHWGSDSERIVLQPRFFSDP
jgi:hypothetical protein